MMVAAQVEQKPPSWLAPEQAGHRDGKSASRSHRPTHGMPQC
jgi:hypothetical protein